VSRPLHTLQLERLIQKFSGSKITGSGGNNYWPFSGGNMSPLRSEIARSSAERDVVGEKEKGLGRMAATRVPLGPE
jgi:hypothetical protein